MSNLDKQGISMIEHNGFFAMDFLQAACLDWLCATRFAGKYDDEMRRMLNPGKTNIQVILPAAVGSRDPAM